MRRVAYLPSSPDYGDPMAGERILVIDDNESHRELMVLTLETLNYSVDTAESGEVGISKVTESPPDLVLLDLTMDGINGFEVCKQLKSRPETRFIPVILLTTSQSTLDKTKGLEAGADDYLIKGIDGRELDARIQWVLARYRKGLAGDPLTRLPGATALTEEIRDRLTQGQKFGIIFLCIREYDPYVQGYGHAKADDLIYRVAGVLRDILAEDSCPDDYAASLTGNNFAVLSSVNRVVGLAEKLVERINVILPEAYQKSDRDRGFMTVTDRRGQTNQYDLMVAIAAIVSNEQRHFEHPEEVFAVGRELLAYIRAMKDRSVMKDRRRG
jgi:DNA-binding response OmpR family regulator